MRQWTLVAQVALATAVMAFAGALVATAVGVSTVSVDPALAVRAALVTVALLLAVVLVVLRARGRLPAGVVVRSAQVGLALGYLLNPFSWVGRSYLTQLWLEPGPLTFVLDFVAWLAVGHVALWVVRSRLHSPEASHA